MRAGPATAAELAEEAQQAMAAQRAQRGTRISMQQLNEAKVWPALPHAGALPGHAWACASYQRMSLGTALTWPQLWEPQTGALPAKAETAGVQR